MFDPRQRDIRFKLDITCLRSITEYLFLHLPMEACGVLRGTSTADNIYINDFIPIRNIAINPQHHFIMQPEEWVRQCLKPHGLIGVFHSHPQTPPTPSNEDLRQLPLFKQLMQMYFIASPAADGVSIHMNAYIINNSAHSSVPVLRPCNLQITN